MMRTSPGAVAWGLLLCARGGSGSPPPELGDLRMLALECPEGATCGDPEYTERGYTCQDSALMKGAANIIEFRCADTGCIHTRGLCNGFANCADGSDERNCQDFRTAASASALAAPFDCSAEYDRWETTWTAEKRRWCCNTAKRACTVPEAGSPPARGDDAAVQPSSDRSDKLLHASKNSRTPHDCQDWASRWSPEKKAYCCHEEETGCTMADMPDSAAPYDCHDNDKVSEWPTAQRDWCCAGLGLHCPTKKEEASDDEKSYDCTTELEAGRVSSAVHWPAAQRRWCCKTAGTGCSGGLGDAGGQDKEAADIYDCEKERSTWETSWAEDKIGWCCKHHEVACGERGGGVQAGTGGGSAEPQQASQSSEESVVEATMACTKAGFVYEPQLAGTSAAIEPNVAACQARCAHNAGCALFSYWTVGGDCQLHSEEAEGRYEGPGVLSAPPTCGDHGRKELEILGDLMRERVCFQRDQAYSPLDAPGAVPQIEETPTVCQLRCAATEWCQAFTYSVMDSMCHLADASSAATADAASARTVAGPRVCEERVTFSLSVGGVKFDVLRQNSTLLIAVEDAVKQAVVTALSNSTQASSTASSLIGTDDVGVVLVMGARGSLSIGVMVAPSSSLPTGLLQRALWDRLHRLEVAVAKYVTKADNTGQSIASLVHVQLLTPPARLDGGGAGSGDGDEYARKFLNGRPSRLAGSADAPRGSVDAGARWPQGALAVAASGGLLVLVVALLVGAVALFTRHSRARGGLRVASASAAYDGMAEDSGLLE